MSMARTLLVSISLLWMLAFAAQSAQAQVVINEVDYDQPGNDAAEFIELRNSGSTSVSLSGMQIRLINGANGGAAVYSPQVSLPNVMLAPGAYFVVCSNAAMTPSCDLDVAPDANLIQNGAPDAIGLFAGNTLIDALSYEGAVPGFTEGTLGALADDGVGLMESLSRCPDGVDTNRNDVDFALRPSTPGAENSCAPAQLQLGACGDPATRISAIQGAGLTSPLAGDMAVVEAIVVGDFQDGNLNGFFLQEEDTDADADVRTSEGLFVFEGASTVIVQENDRVRVLGQVAELSSQTQLGNVQDLLVCPAATVASRQTVSFPVNAVNDLERFEGMRAQITQPLTVTSNFELGRFGSVDLSIGGRLFNPTQRFAPGTPANDQQALNDRSRIILDDASNRQNPNPIPYLDASRTRRTGDTLPSLQGILSGSFGAYRIHPTVALAQIAFESGNPRTPAPDPVGGSLRVSTFNVLNYFTTLDQGQPVCGPTGGLDCRGANTIDEFVRQRTKIVNALVGLDADIFGLIELENNATAAAADLVSALNARVGAGTYAFIDTGTIGTDAIKVALLYRTRSVRPVGSFAILDRNFDPRFIDNLNRPSLAQTFEETATGARFTVINNHLKSKGSDCDRVGDPDRNDGQDNCPGTRNMAAQALLAFIAADPTRSGDPDFLVIGDLNSHAQEDSIRTLVAGGLSELIGSFVGPNAYSFQFMGQFAYLDYALATPSLAPQVSGVTEWHINADEPVVLDYNLEFKTDDLFQIDNPFRASDHDPLLVGLALEAPEPAVLSCLGRPASVFVSDGVIVGGPDTGLPYAGVLRGGRGVDVIVGTSRSDEIHGGGGADIVCGGRGDDRLIGSTGAEVMFGELGNDELFGDGGADLLDGGPGNDRLLGAGGSDTLVGQDGDDTLVGDSGQDFLFGGPGVDSCNGGSGSDVQDGTCETTISTP